MINIIFNTLKSFIHIHIVISNYAQKIFQVLILKITLDKVRLSFYNFKTILEFRPKLSKHVQLPQQSICITHICSW